MTPEAVTVGARVARRMIPIVMIAAARSPDQVSFFGGVLATIAGGVAGVVGPQTAAELLRVALSQLEKQPQLALPPGARVALANAQDLGAIESAQPVDRCPDGSEHLWMPRQDGGAYSHSIGPVCKKCGLPPIGGVAVSPNDPT